jgi:integrase
MTALRLRYVQAWVDGEGRVHHYFRRAGFPRVRLPGLPGSAQFLAAYQAALDTPAFEIGSKRSTPGSVSMAIAAFYGSTSFAALAPRTKQMRHAILERFRAEHGDKPIKDMPQKFLVALLAKKKPFAARNWLKTLRQLLQFAISIELRSDDPTQGIKLAKVKSDGHHTWDEDQIAAYEAFHPIGSKARLALALGIYTAQRRGDVIRMGRQHIRDGVLTVKQQKTGVELAIPVHPQLQAILDATPAAHLTLLTTKSGQPYAGNDFSEQFRAWCNAAGLPKVCKFHGLRKAALTRLADAGCSTHMIAAISGHLTLKEIQRYTNKADRARLAREAMAQLVKNSGATKSVKASDV